MTTPRHRIARFAAPSAPAPFSSVALALFALVLFGFAGSASAAGGELVLVPDPITMVALIIFFALLVFPLNALLFKPIFAALDAREDRIAGTRARADHLAAEAERTMQEYEASVREVREEAEQGRKAALAEARNGGQAHTRSARADADAELERASGEIAISLERARSSLRGDAETLAREAAAAVLGRSLS